MRVRQAVERDAAAIRAIVVDAYSMYVPRIGREPAPMLDDYAARIASGSAFVVDCDGEVGGLLVLIAEGDALQVENVAVAPARQGQGIGRALLAFAESEAARRSLRRLTLYTNEKMTENLSLYAALGWREVGRGQQDGFARVFFEKSL